MIDIDDLILKINIVEYISQYIELYKKNDEYWGISPFSGKDINPSFSITPSKNLYYDYSDGSGGNVLNFIMAYNKVNFRNAIAIATKYVGGNIVELSESLEATKEIKKFQLRQKHQKKTKYKILPSDIMLKYDFNIDKLKTWIDEGISIEILKKYQVRYDAFANRIVYPIFDEYNSIINIKGRTLDNDFQSKKIQKYINYFEIGVCDYVYNLNFAKEEIRKRNKVIIFEGEKSVLLAESYGIHNTIAIMTSHLNDAQMKLLIKLGVDVVFALDEDVRIFNDKNILKLKKYLKVEYIYDTNHVLKLKNAPIDCGLDIFKMLYNERRLL